MYKIRSHIVIFLCFWPLLVLAQSHDYEVRDFHENTTDLTAVSSNVKDLNGKTAALIRFAVRDTLFSFEANNGIIQQRKTVGEVQLYVPQGTKRITIRHPYLGILRDYQLPMFIESKTTYDAEIVITNTDYMRKLIGGEQHHVETMIPEADTSVNTESPVETDSEEQQEEQVVENTSVDDILTPRTEKQKKPHTPMKVNFILGGGYNAFSLMGPNISAGVQLGKMMLSTDYTIGLQKVEGVGIYEKTTSSNGGIVEAYDYSASRFSVRLGVVSPNVSVQMIPQVGVSFNMIRGKELVGKVGSTPQFSKSYPISLLVAASLRIRLYKPLHLAITPQYDFAIGADDVYKVIKSADKKVKAWGEGFVLNAGLLFQF